jgi:hypothetical protein
MENSILIPIENIKNLVVNPANSLVAQHKFMYYKMIQRNNYYHRHLTLNKDLFSIKFTNQ